IALGIVGVFVSVEDIDDAEAPDRQHQAVRRLRAGELIDIFVDFLGFAAEIDGLPDERALDPRVGVIRAELVGFGTWESGNAMRVADTKTLIDLRIEPKLGALPQPQAGIERRIHRLASLPAGDQAIAAQIR